MKLKLVGTGAIKGPDRSACSLVDDKILIDCGNGLLKTLEQQQVDIMKIEALLITHLHADHFFDLPFYVLLRFVTPEKIPLKIYCPSGTEKMVEFLCDNCVAQQKGIYKKWKDEGKFEFIEFESLQNEEITKGYFATSYLVSHGDVKLAYGYTIKHNNKCVGFSGDTTYCNSVEEIVKGSQVAVLDMFSTTKTKAHMSVEEIINICKNYPDKIIVGTHSTQQARVEGLSQNIKNLVVATDGYELEF